MINGKTLGMQWGWNHNPDPTKWSLTKRSGYLRLATASVTSDFRMARNTLTQRPFAHYDQSVPTTAITKLDVAKMKDGDVAGLAIFQEPYAYIGLKQENGTRYVVMVNNGKAIDSIAIGKQATVYLRTIASNKTKKATFEYSVDNQVFKALGDELVMQFSLKYLPEINSVCSITRPKKLVAMSISITYEWIVTQPKKSKNI